MLMPVACKNELVHLIFRHDVISKTGRPRKLSTIQALNCIFFICRTGCQWSELPCPQGIHFKTVYHRFRTWTRLRVFEDGFYNLVAKYTAQTKLPLVADTSYVKNVHGRDVLGRNHTDRGRKATKVSLLSDSKSVPLALAFHQGNRNDCMTLGHLLGVAKRKACCIKEHHVLHADKGYDTISCRNACKHFGLQAFIPHKRTDESWNDIRYAVEVTFARFDNFRRIILRFDFSITSFKSFHFFAAACLVAKEI